MNKVKFYHPTTGEVVRKKVSQSKDAIWYKNTGVESLRSLTKSMMRQGFVRIGLRAS